MASSPIPSQQIEGEKAEAVTDFIFLHSKITADGNCSHEIERLLGRLLAPWKESYDKTRQHMKSRITLPTKVCIVEAMLFPEVLYRCESWTIQETECQRIDAFKLWCWRRLPRVPRTARRSNHSVLKEINPECLC